MKRIFHDPLIIFCVSLGAGFLLFQYLFLWMHINIDGYFYWAIGQYFKTGIYPYIEPFIYSKPITISPPLYGIFLSLIGIIPQGEKVLHLIQIIMMAVTTILLCRILTSWITKRTAAIVSLLFLIFPTNVIFVSAMMTELPAQTAMTIYLYLLHKFLNTNKIAILGILVVLTAIMTLLKYQFIFLFVFQLLYLLWTIRKHPIKHISLFFPVTLGTLIISIWILINHNITGVWGLSDTKKMPYYTNFVWDGKYYPPENHPAVLALRQYVPETADKYAEYWDLQDYILPHVNRNWHDVDELLGNVGIAAIQTHPWEYLIHGIQVFIRTHGHRAPWWQNLETFGSRDPIQPLYCDALKTIQLCKPVIMTPNSYSLWNSYVHFSRNVYDIFFSKALQFIFLPLLLIVLLIRQWNKRIYALIYLINLIPISYLAMTESRYLIPYYPLIIIITVIGIKSIIRQKTI